jgi:hypothetical protein
MSELTTTSQIRAQRVERLRARLSSPGDPEPAGEQAGRELPSLLFGVWLHAAARAEQGVELTEFERSILNPLQEALGEEEVSAFGRVYREVRTEGRPVALVPEAVTSRGLEEGYGLEEYAAAMVERLPQIAAAPNLAVVEPARLAAGEDVATPAFAAATARYGFGVTAFTGPVDQEAVLRASTAFRARLEWGTFYCTKAVGDQGGGKDEIYWTAASNATGYTHTTRTGVTGSVKEGNSYPISGDHDTGSMALFDTMLNGCGTAIITLWESDQSHAEWYDALGKALQEAVDALKFGADFSSFFPGLDLYGHMYEALSFISQIWEFMRNKDDLVLTIGWAFGPAALGAIHSSHHRTALLNFDNTSEGMGNFQLSLRYTGDEPIVPDGSVTRISDAWRGLVGTAFTQGVDAACQVPGNDSDVYLFRGTDYVRYNVPTEQITWGPKPITVGWPGLGVIFASGVDAVCNVPGSSTDVHFFRGAQYVRYNVPGNKIVYGPKAIIEGWPGMWGAPSFGIGLDAACPVTGHSTDIYMFAGEYYLRYNFAAKKIVNGPKLISEGWPQLAGTNLAYNLSAACSVPRSSSLVYLFKDEWYRTYSV